MKSVGLALLIGGLLLGLIGTYLLVCKNPLDVVFRLSDDGQDMEIRTMPEHIAEYKRVTGYYRLGFVAIGCSVMMQAIGTILTV